LVAVVVSKDKQSDKTKRDTKNSVKSHSHYTFTDNDEYTALINQSQPIGYGVYNPHSMYRVRMLLHETIHPGLTKDIRSLRKEMQRGADFSENDALKSILEKKITDAIRLRMAMNLPSFDTDTYRLINGEGDGLSGLAVDIIGGNTAIVMSSAAWCEIHKDTILYILSKSLALHPSYENETVDIVWRNTPSRLAQDGYELVQEIERESEDVSVIATESSIKYMTYPYSDGQKTGFYCDQRDNRRTIAKYCENKRVLDLCCYSGGFSLNAVIHGNAASAVGVDSSQDAVDSCTENARLNGLDENSISFVRDDIAAFMKNAIDRNEQYDVVILDPPKLAPSISTLTKASRKYHSLNRDAMNLIDKTRGGLLLTCTCSAAMTQSNGGQFFLGVVNSAALSAKRQATLMAVNGAAPCHTQSPASFPAGNYLTCALFFIGPVE
jgi:23S rRNA G2069 N7-methylase RlmK/C1962 C5-methylase RlmI